MVRTKVGARLRLGLRFGLRLGLRFGIALVLRMVGICSAIVTTLNQESPKADLGTSAKHHGINPSILYRWAYTQD